MVKKVIWGAIIVLIVVVGYVGYTLLTTKSHSPAAVAEFKDGDFSIQLNYCQPYKKGRLIFGAYEKDALVPFGMKWRTGANEATEISFSSDVTINGQPLKAGKYSLYTIPGESSWTVAFNSKLGYWGAKPGGDPFEESLDVLRATASVMTNQPEVEQFTISFTPADSLVNMNFFWDKTRITLPITRTR